MDQLKLLVCFQETDEKKIAHYWCTPCYNRHALVLKQDLLHRLQQIPGVRNASLVRKHDHLYIVVYYNDDLFTARTAVDNIIQEQLMYNNIFIRDSMLRAFIQYKSDWFSDAIVDIQNNDPAPAESVVDISEAAIPKSSTLAISQTTQCIWCSQNGHSRSNCAAFKTLKQQCSAASYVVKQVTQVKQSEHQGFAAAALFPYLWIQQECYVLMAFDKKRHSSGAEYKDARLEFLGGQRDNPQQSIVQVASRELKEETNDLLLPETWQALGEHGEHLSQCPTYWDAASKKIIIAVQFPLCEADLPVRAAASLQHSFQQRQQHPEQMAEGAGEIRELVWIPLTQLLQQQWTSQMFTYVQREVQEMFHLTNEWQQFITFQ